MLTQRLQNYIPAALGIGWLAAIGAIAWLTPRHQTAQLLALFGIAFGAYALLIRQFRVPTRVEIGFAIAARVMVVFAFPQLSDDVWRFIWDGQLTLQGINPLSDTPSRLMATGTLSPDMAAIFPKLNSPEYYTIYPPVCQWVFAAACRLAGTDYYWAAVFMKLFLLLCELGSILLLYRLIPRYGVRVTPALYALNPLAIIEICGNAHFEGAMVVGVLVAFYGMLRLAAVKTYAGMAISMAGMFMAVASKLLPLMFAPLWLRQLGLRRSLVYWLMVMGLFVAAWWPQLADTAPHLLNSVGLYFRTFEFNASVYYLLRELGYLLKGYNLIGLLGPLLALTSASFIVFMGLKPIPQLPNLAEQMLLAIAMYLFCSPTIHPWYTLLPLALSALTRFRFAAVWTFCAMLSYTAYIVPEVHELLWLTLSGYAVVWWVLYQDLKEAPSDEPRTGVI